MTDYTEKPIPTDLFAGCGTSWLDEPPVSEWPEHEQKCLLDVLNGLSVLAGDSYEKPLYVLRELISDYEALAADEAEKVNR